MNWSSFFDKFDSLFASCSRPYTVYACGTAVAICCFIPQTASEALPIAGAVIGGFIAARSTEKIRGATNPCPPKDGAAQ